MSDEEINKASRKLFDCSPESAYGYAFREGAKWASKDLEKKLAEANAAIKFLNNSVREFSESSCKKGKKLTLALEALKDIHDYGEYSDHRDTPKIWRKCDETLKQLSE